MQTSPDRGPLFRWQVPESGDVEYRETGCESVIRLCGVVGVRRASPPLRFCGSVTYAATAFGIYELVEAVS